MNNKNIGIAAAFLVIGLLVGYALTNDRFSQGPGMMYGKKYADLDRVFIEEMIPHHEGAVAMAELALTKAKTSEVKSLAGGVIDSQTREINNMKAWYKEWYGVDVPKVATGTGMMGHGMHMDTFSGDLTVLSQAQNFDLEFVNQMIPHHEMAVMMTRMMLSGTERPELKTLADQIITSQTREIEMMRSWQKTWRTQ